ncbi:MAG: glycoside hydrolase family 95-like protein, partial [Arachnia sp.]
EKTGRIDVTGTLASNGLQYNAQTQITTQGGTIDASGATVTVTGADSAWLVWSAATDYQLSYPAYRTGETSGQLKSRVTSVVDAAAAKGFDALQAAHETDYKELFDRVKLDLNGATLTSTTDAARSAYNGTTAQDRTLETLYYQYGRYLLISSSREGSLPANLQGVWNNRNDPPWSSDYHTNINLQMNYWPALSANLGETTSPYLDYIKDLSAAGTDSASNVLGFDKGWMVMNETTPFGFTGVFDWSTAFWFPEANAWLAQAFYWEWLYNRDVDFLRDEAWPVLKGAADFWEQYLQVDPRDGTLVANPSYSPEQGPFTAGAAMSQQVAAEVFESTIAAAEVLGKQGDVTDISAALSKMDRGLHVGDDGLMKEWKTDGITGESGHRHVSHLYSLFPGRAISPTDTPELATAAEASLRDRGDGGTGWSMAWKVNFWAQLLDGDHSHQMLRNLIRNSTYANLWDAHPPFQIDGNFGGTSGVNEMLVQNDADRVSVLPALPSAWASQGSFDGIRAWNNVTVGATWASGNATEIRIDTASDGPINIHSAMADAGVKVVDEDGAAVTATTSGGVITFEGAVGGRYTLAPVSSLEYVDVATSMDYSSDTVVTMDVTGAPEMSRVDVEVPEGWQVAPSSQWVAAGDSRITFTLRAPNTGSTGTINASLVHPSGVISSPVSIALVNPAAISHTELSVAGWDSLEPTGEGAPNGWASMAVDGNEGTFWHTQWSGGVAPFPHYIIVDLGKERELGSFTYVPRILDGNPRNGQIGKYKLEVASGGTFVPPTQDQLNDLSYLEPVDATWTSVASGEWPVAVPQRHTVSFGESVTGRYVKLTATSGYSTGGSFTHAAELVFQGTSVAAPGPLADEPAAARIAVEPSKASPGDTVVLTGGGFAPGETVDIHVGDAATVQTVADANGFIRADIDVPAEAVTSVVVRVEGMDASATVEIIVTGGTVTPTATATASPSATSTASATASPTVTPTATLAPTRTATPSVTPSVKPSATTQPPAPGDLYTTPGFHHVNGRHWYTSCEKYSQTTRCRTQIWSTQVMARGGAFVSETGWHFNNLTYLPSSRSLWRNNPLGNTGSWVDQAGRNWMTECDTPRTGRNGCRTWILTDIVVSTAKAGGGYTYRLSPQFVFNNLVLFN